MTVETLKEYFNIVYRWGDGAVFRGQGEDYAQLLPTYYRSTNPPPISAAAQLVAKLYQDVYQVEAGRTQAIEEDERNVKEINKRDVAWQELTENPESFAPNILAGVGTPAMYNEYYGYTLNDQKKAALLQHYGIPSIGLDVSYEPLVALFFATHRFLQIEERGGRYNREPKDGVVYILCPESRDLVDLRGGKQIPTAGLRGQRQEGALLFSSSPEEINLAKFIKYKIFVNSKTWNEVNNERFGADKLFPSVEEDLFYKKLLEWRSGTEVANNIASWIVKYI